MYAVKFISVCALLGSMLISCTSAGRKDEGRIVREYRPVKKKSIEEPPRYSDEKISGRLDPLIEKYWGADYRMGAEGPGRFDCSGFIKRIFSEAYDYSLPRSSKEQYEVGSPVSKSDLEYADLVFFATNGRRAVSHVGVYIGNGKFAHASTSVGVTITALDSDYYTDRYLGARRVLK